MKRATGIIGGLIIAAAAVGAISIISGALVEETDPNRRKTDCWFPVPADFSVACYRVSVPESRAGKVSITLQIPVAVVSMPAIKRRNEPVVYLAGGPGDGAWIDADRIDFWWDFVRENAWLNQRELILLDQRGTGNVIPRIDCPEMERAKVNLLSLGRDFRSATRLLKGAAGDCFARVRARGHDPGRYTTTDSVEDLHAIRRSLGYDRWHVYGLSYGTRLALSYLSRYPGDFHTVILDSVDPPHIDFYADDAWRTQRAFDAVLEACRSDPACRSWYPNLEDRLTALVHRLNASPLDFDVATSDEDHVQVRLTGDLLLIYLFLNLYNRDDIAVVPMLIDLFDRGQMEQMEFEMLQLVHVWTDRPDWGDALSLTISCAEDMPVTDVRRMRASYRAYPLLQSLADAPAPFEACSDWNVPSNDMAERELVRSSVPALVLAGTFDPITPPQYGREAAAGLANSHYFEFPGVGHDVLGTEPCANRIAAIFLNDPWRTPNDPCLISLGPPKFDPPVQ